MSKVNECPKAATGHAWVLNVKPNVCLFCGVVKGQAIAVDKNVPLPKERRTKLQSTLDRIFKLYADQYQRLYTRRPERYEFVKDTGFIHVYIGGVMHSGVSLQRMRQLTANMKGRRAE